MKKFLCNSNNETLLEKSEKLKQNTHLLNVNLLKQFNQQGKFRGNCSTIINDYQTAFKPMILENNDVTINQITIYPLHHTMSFMLPSDASNHKTSDYFFQEQFDLFSLNKCGDNSNNNAFLQHKHKRDQHEHKEFQLKTPLIIKHYSAPINLPTKKLFCTKSTEENTIDLRAKLRNDVDNIYKCSHPDCNSDFKTKKQKLTHHIKMDNDCHRDTIVLLKSISSLKTLLISNTFNKNHNLFTSRIITKYEDIISKVSIEDHAMLISGLKFFK